MFTGIVDSTARVKSASLQDSIRTFVLEFRPGFTEDLKRGGSVSVDGVCLTATKFLSDDLVSFDVIAQSLAVTTLASLQEGSAVNVERAARDGAEIGGHPLSGHVDFASRIIEVAVDAGNKRVRMAIPTDFKRYIFAKGYIAINGCSLTIAECDRENGWFDVWLIPETRATTNWDDKRVDDEVNVEIERGTQVVVDTVRETAQEALGNLYPVLVKLFQDKDIPIDELVTKSLNSKLLQSR
ncbi:MAG: riboflavin synthase subunit alpha [Novosphingobium sp.]